MAVEENADTAVAWEAEECIAASNEQLALTRFASRLSSSVGKDEPGIVDAGDVRQEAELLMCLLSPQSSSKLFCPDNEDLSGLTALSEMSCSNSPSEFRLQPRRRREGFAFSCPSLSLDTTCVSNTMLEPCVTTSSTSSSAVKERSNRDSVSPTPGVLFSRPLRVDDRDALRLSAEAMARNLLLSYKKALEWRIQAWVNTLSTVLLRSEQELIRKGASKEEIEKLLETSEAQLIVKLQRVGQKIDVLDARTSFEVLARRILPSDQTSPSPPNKKQRLEDDMSSAFRTETEYKYTVSHVLSMDCVLYLMTPAGYSEVALNVPGVITGTFLSTEPGVEELTAVNVELETNILASMVEKSCRIVVRSSVEAMAEEGNVDVDNENIDQPMTDISSPDLKRNDSPSAEMASPPPEAAIVTPRHPSPPSLYLDADMEEKAALLSIPDEFKSTSGRRLVSPQPKSPELSGFAEFTPRTPQPMQTEMSSPSLISPPLTTSSIEYAEIKSRGGPSLPALVEAACAAMKEA